MEVRRGRAARCRRASARSAGRASARRSRSGGSRRRAGRGCRRRPSRRASPRRSSSGRASPAATSRRSRNSIVIGCGNFGAPPQPPLRGVEARSSAADRRVEQRRPGRRRHRRRRRPLLLGERLRRAAGRARRPRRAARPRLARRPSSTWRNDGIPWRGSSGKYVPPKNGRPSGVRNTRHRPAALAGHRLDGAHVDLVEVRPLLAVDLDRDELLVEHRRPSPRPRTTRAP